MLQMIWTNVALKRDGVEIYFCLGKRTILIFHNKLCYHTITDHHNTNLYYIDTKPHIHIKIPPLHTTPHHSLPTPHHSLPTPPPYTTQHHRTNPVKTRQNRYTPPLFNTFHHIFHINITSKKYHF